MRFDVRTESYGAVVDLGEITREELGRRGGKVHHVTARDGIVTHYAELGDRIRKRAKLKAERDAWFAERGKLVTADERRRR